jgi:hypothetical protein
MVSVFQWISDKFVAVNPVVDGRRIISVQLRVDVGEMNGELLAKEMESKLVSKNHNIRLMQVGVGIVYMEGTLLVRDELTVVMNGLASQVWSVLGKRVPLMLSGWEHNSNDTKATHFEYGY